jgi:hypothetical protein
MGQWGEPFHEENIYHIGGGKRIRVRKTFIDHFYTCTEPFHPISSKSVADMRLLLDVCVDGDVSPENAAAVREWILGGLKTEIPEFLRIACNLEPKGERIMGEKIELGSKVKDSVTGAEGTVTVRAEYFSGSVPRVLIEGMSEGKPFELWVEESRCIVQGE